MLRELKFVQGAVSKKNFVPSMTHFAIENGTVRAYNGTLALCSPLPFEIACKPKAAPLVQAISNCNETIALSLTPTGKLRIQSGKFRALIDCVDGETPHVNPEGEIVQLDGQAMLQAIKTIYPFVGNDASRPWSNGILLRGQSAFATNNVCLVEYWIGATMPITMNVPRVAIKEMLRIDEPPSFAQVSSNSITFHYEDGRWVRTQLFSNEWPDLEKVLGVKANAVQIDERIFEGLDVIKPFADKMGRVFFKDQMLLTHVEGDEGATFELEGFNYEGAYQIEMLKLLQGVANQIDFSCYPKPCIFYGERLRGAIVGMHI